MLGRVKGAPQKSKKMVLEVLDMTTEKFRGASSGPA